MTEPDWDVRSYIMERVASKAAVQPDSFFLSHYDFTTLQHKKSEASTEIQHTLEDLYKDTSQHTLSFCGYGFSCVAKAGCDWSALEKRVSQIATTQIKEGLSTTENSSRQKLNTLAAAFDIPLQDAPEPEGLTKCAALYQLYEYLAPMERDILISCKEMRMSLSGCSWPVGVAGVASGETGENVFVRQESLGCDPSLSHAMVEETTPATFERGVRIRVTFLGDDLSDLWCFAQVIHHINSYASLMRFLRQVAGGVSTVRNFFCDGNDGFELSLDSLLDDQNCASPTGKGNHGHLWRTNQRHVVEAVRTGNTADAAHLLQGNYNPSLVAACEKLTSSLLPHTEVLISVTVPEKHLVITETFDSFFFLSRTKTTGCLCVRTTSPLFNYFYQKGDTAHFSFSKSKSGEPQAPQVCQHTMSEQWKDGQDGTFTVLSASAIGDSALIFGELCFRCADFEVPVFSMLSLATPTWVKRATTEILASPFVATVLHRSYGLVGFSGSSCSLASHFPPVLALLVPAHYVEFPLEENMFDPNVLLYYFNSKNSALFSKNYAETFDTLPVSLVDTESLAETELSARVRGRYIRHIPPLSAEMHDVVILVSVTSITFGLDEEVLTKRY